MTLVAIPAGYLIIPDASGQSIPGLHVTSHSTMDAASEKVAWVFRAPKTGTLDQLEFLFKTVAQAPSNGLRISFQDLEEDQGTIPYIPDGTQDQYRDIAQGSIVTGAWIAPGLMTDNGTDGGVKRSVTAGDLIAAVVEFASFSAGDDVDIAHDTTYRNLPVEVGVVAYIASWAINASNALHPAVALKYNDGTYESINSRGSPRNHTGTKTHVTGLNTTPDEVALRFKLPFTARAWGVQLKCAGLGAAENVTVKLLASDDTERATTGIIEPDFAIQSSNCDDIVPFTAPYTIEANTEYRLSVTPLTSGTINIHYISVESAAHMDAMLWGAEFYKSTRTDGGDWTDVTTDFPFIGLVLDQLDDGAGKVPQGLHPIGAGIIT